MKVSFKLDLKENTAFDRALHNVARQFSISQDLLSGTVEVDGETVGTWKLDVEEKK